MMQLLEQHNQTGWKVNIFTKWFTATFVPYANTLTGEKILFLNGHHSHISSQLFAAATDNQIRLAKLIAHSRHSLQPLDVGVFQTVNAEWKLAFEQDLKENGVQEITKPMFSTLLKLAVEKGFKSENSVSGFKAIGIFT